VSVRNGNLSLSRSLSLSLSLCESYAVGGPGYPIDFGDWTQQPTPRNIPMPTTPLIDTPIPSVPERTFLHYSNRPSTSNPKPPSSSTPSSNSPLQLSRHYPSHHHPQHKLTPSNSPIAKLLFLTPNVGEAINYEELIIIRFTGNTYP